MAEASKNSNSNGLRGGGVSAEEAELKRQLSSREQEIQTLKSKEKALYQRLQATEKSRRELRRRMDLGSN